MAEAAFSLRPHMAFPLSAKDRETVLGSLPLLARPLVILELIPTPGLSCNLDHFLEGPVCRHSRMGDGGLHRVTCGDTVQSVTTRAVIQGLSRRNTGCVFTYARLRSDFSACWSV